MHTLKRFIEIQLAEIEPRWTAEGKGGYWWGVKVGLETVLNNLDLDSGCFTNETDGED